MSRPAFPVPADRRIADLDDAAVTFRETIAAFRFLVDAPFVRGHLVTAVFPGAGTDVAVVHGFPRLSGYLPVRDSAGVSVYDGTPGAPAGSTNLRATGAATVTLWVF